MQQKEHWPLLAQSCNLCGDEASNRLHFMLSVQWVFVTAMTI